MGIQLNTYEYMCARPWPTPYPSWKTKTETDIVLAWI
jgi:hypothetical protein